MQKRCDYVIIWLKGGWNMSERLMKKLGSGNFYLLAFLVAFALFILLQVFVMQGVLGYYENKYPGFIRDFQKAISNMNTKPELMTEPMWAVQNLSQFIGTGILAILMIIVFWKSFAADWKRFKSEWRSHVPTIIFGFIIIYVLNIVLAMLYNLFQVPGDATNQKLIESAVESSTGIFMVLSVFLLAPFVEEVLFRKLLYGTMEEKFRLRPVFAIIISAILFAAMHAVDIFFFRYLPLALVLCIAYSLSKNNIFVPMGIHFLNNSTIIIFFIKTVLK